MSLTRVAEQPQQPAIPAFQPNISETWEIIGQKEQQILQLQKTILMRAQEANQLHDALLALQAQYDELKRTFEMAGPCEVCDQKHGARDEDGKLVQLPVPEPKEA